MIILITIIFFFLLFRFVFVFCLQWIPIDEYVNQTYNREHKPFEYIARICLTKSQSNYGGFSAVHTLTSSGKQPYLYFNGQDFKHLD